MHLKRHFQTFPLSIGLWHRFVLQKRCLITYYGTRHLLNGIAYLAITWNHWKNGPLATQTRCLANSWWCTLESKTCFSLQMESSSKIVHENLKSIIDYQTHHRLREAQGEEFAELLNERVHIWSAGQALIILLVGAGQILILRSFFTDKRWWRLCSTTRSY